MNKYYTGIGSRQTPDYMCRFMTKLARFLDKSGYILRSGGADGADTAFEDGATNKDIFLPWKGFNDNLSLNYYTTEAAYELAAKFHPAWESCSPAARKLHARNGMQVLGLNLDVPSEFLICWTPVDDPHRWGGTGQAIRIANAHDVPVFNLRTLSTLASLLKFIKEKTGQEIPVKL